MQKEVTIEWSFDDGSVLDIRTASLLSQHGLTATFYIIVDRVGQEGFLNWDEIKELEKMGMTIGSHTVTHPGDMKALFDEELHYETQNSKDMLEAVLGHPVSRFCYPRGRADDRVKQMVAKAGYVDARGTGRPGITTKEDVLYLPGTVHIFQRPEYESTPVLTFAIDTIDRVRREGGYCNIWGHSAEIDKNNLWVVLEEVMKYSKWL